MRRRPESTEAGWALGKAAVLVAVFGTLAGFTMLSHFYSHDRAERIACLDNQRATDAALLYYQVENGGSSPSSLEELKDLSPDRSRRLGRCPSDSEAKYTCDVATGRVLCPNPNHRRGF
jgi:hypothetical protein